MGLGGWIGVDLDGTLAHYEGWNDGAIGKPIPLMVRRVKEWLEAGEEVRIFTARVHAHSLNNNTAELVRVVEQIENWCLEHIGRKLTVTCAKDFGMRVLYDDRCVQVEPNTGRIYHDDMAEAEKLAKDD